MHPQTFATLQQLENVEWFSNVGKRDTEAAVVVSSWKEAIDLCGAAAWKNLELEAANQLRERILEKSKERFLKWNEVADEVRQWSIPFVQRKIAAAIKRNNLPKVFEDMVQWDIAHLLMESEYSDVFPPAYFASQGYWYMKGHFPCGWEGEFPAGRLIIY